MFFDTSFLADYLQGEQYTADFLDDHDGRYYTISLVRFELFNGALKHPSPKKTPQQVKEALQWLRVEPFIDDMALRAADIQNRLRQRGAVLSSLDALIAGAALEYGETLVSNDNDFARVDQLDTLTVG